MKEHDYIKGRGAQINPNGHYSANRRRNDYECFDNNENLGTTQYRTYRAKSLVNYIPSPDIGFNYSFNVYQGCEHGCTYCYARNSHAYHDLGTGLDFERKIQVKINAPELLSTFLNKPKWKAQTIMMSGNTDCYQPAESKFELSRRCLKVFLNARHPVGIITKNSLIQRDIDLLEQLAELQLVTVLFSLTTLNEELRRKMEPRTATAKQKLKVIEKFSNAGIPCSVMMAPIIPALNSHEIFDIAKASSKAGAESFHHATVRLNGDVSEIFENWIRQSFPDKADHVLNGIRSLHLGQLNNSNFHERMKGSGVRASNIHQMARLAKQKYFSNSKKSGLRTDLHLKNGQMKLF